MRRKRATGLAQSIQARLRALADREDRPYAELLLLYGIERFLHRLARSKHRGDFILKGAVMLRLWLGFDTRPTRDIDLLGPEGLGEEGVRKALADIVMTEVEDDGLEFDPESVAVRQFTVLPRTGFGRLRSSARRGEL